MWSGRYGSAYKKVRLRDQFYTRRQRMYGHLSQEEQLKGALLRAARHARIVSTRSIVSPRNIRVGDFVTSLRREIKEATTYSNQDLSNKDMWEDILVPSELNRFSKEQLKAIKSARLLIDKMEPAEIIEEEIAKVNVELNDIFSMIKDIESINEEADEILTGFKELAKDM